jgi:hypothetical protein
MLGLRIPDDMQGQVIHELAEHALTVEYEAASAAPRRTEREEVYSAHELQRVTERLSDLGYLE